MPDDHLTGAEIEVLLLRHMPRGAWLTLPDLYKLVETHSDLASSDWLGAGRSELKRGVVAT